jgi:hypothetical protein
MWFRLGRSRGRAWTSPRMDHKGYWQGVVAAMALGGSAQWFGSGAFCVGMERVGAPPVGGGWTNRESENGAGILRWVAQQQRKDGRFRGRFEGTACRIRVISGRAGEVEVEVGCLPRSTCLLLNIGAILTIKLLWLNGWDLLDLPLSAFLY